MFHRQISSLFQSMFHTPLVTPAKPKHTPQKPAVPASCMICEKAPSGQLRCVFGNVALASVDAPNASNQRCIWQRYHGGQRECVSPKDLFVVSENVGKRCQIEETNSKAPCITSSTRPR